MSERTLFTRQTARDVAKLLRLARGDLDCLATDARLSAIVFSNGASALDWAGTALTNVRAALARIDRGLADDSGSAAVELGLILAILGPVAIWAGGHAGPAVLDFAAGLPAQIETAAAALADLCAAISDGGGTSAACPEAF